MKKVFIDGSQGTTGLRIHDRLKDRTDIELIEISEEDRKNPDVIRKCINKSDVTIMCLPDQASIEHVSYCTNPDTVIIDTSTAFRTDKSFTYGFAELGDTYSHLKNSKRIANPGCHASGFISLIYPLVHMGIIDSKTELSCFSLTGYSGGGKKMIAEYESEVKPALDEGPRQYGLSQTHKHLKEMKEICGLDIAPIFVPIVDDFYSGMQVMVPLHKSQIKLTIDELTEFYKNYYKNSKIICVSNEDESGFMSSVAFRGKDSMVISVKGNDDRIVLTSRFDNLGKGASGSAIENLNIVLGMDETTSLYL